MILHNLYREGRILNWVHEKNIYDISNSITDAVYMFATFRSAPTSKEDSLIIPESVFYIGMSGGNQETHVLDRKNNKNESEKQQTYSTVYHLRMKSHNGKKGKLNDPYVKNLREKGFQVYVRIIMPPEDMPRIEIKSWLSALESYMINLYIREHKKYCQLNLAEKKTTSKKLQNRSLERYIDLKEHQQKIKETSLERFL